MKRWAGPAALVILACATLILFHASTVQLLRDTDTAVLLDRISRSPNPFGWFWSDWPLQNHFYRPITSLSFELDLALWGLNPRAFGLTSAFICAMAVMAVFWLAAELGLRPFAAASAATLFALWQLPLRVEWYLPVVIAAAVVGAGGLWRHGRLRPVLPAVLALAYFSVELYGPFHREAPDGFYAAVFGWLPSRTATLMCAFGLAAMASYLRYERLRSPSPAEPPMSTELPATRTSTQRRSASRGQGGFALLAVLFVSMALGSYEQAITLPAVMLVLAIYVLGQGRPVQWTLQAAFWGVLIVYSALRWSVLPQVASTYQLQAVRSGLTVLVTLGEYVLPAAVDLPSWIGNLHLGAAALMAPTFYSWPWNLAGNVVAYGRALGNRIAGVAWLASLVAVAPMAFLKPFAHYHYWPSAIRSIFVVALFSVVSKLVVSAWSLPTIQAPARRWPAPGSLPRQ